MSATAPLRWRDDLPDRWDDVLEVPPLPEGQTLDELDAIEGVDAPAGFTVRDERRPHAYVTALEQDVVVDVGGHC